VNLSPASVPKQGSGFDLAIAITVLAAAGLIDRESIGETVHLGELALDGSIRSVRGVIPMVLVARDDGIKRVIVPKTNEAEARLVSGIEIIGFEHLTQVANYHGANVTERPGTTSDQVRLPEHRDSPKCFSEVRGQQEAVLAATVAAVGAHHISLIGSPGCGKTMIAQRLASVLPELSEPQAMEVASIRSIASGSPVAALDFQPPFEAPHHSSSMIALVGGGSGIPKPGVITRAHHGVLFLDEAPEFNSSALDALRQPLESGEVQIARANYSVRYPARIQLVLAANPCPCAKPETNRDQTVASCDCSERTKQRYLGRLSGPLMDRIDIQLRMRPVNPHIALDPSLAADSSSILRERVVEARARTSHRLAQTPWLVNAQVSAAHLRQISAHLDSGDRLRKALIRGQISMRGFDKCLRLAWSSADLAGRKQPNTEDFALAIWLRGVETSMAKAA
jgi:magnesium chelatase family protein